MTKQTSTIEFKVVASPSGLTFQYDTPKGHYHFDTISLSGYHGELALPVARRDTVDFIRDGQSLTKTPMTISANGYEASIVRLSDLPVELQTNVHQENDGSQHLQASPLNEDDVVRCCVDEQHYPDHPGALIAFFEKDLKMKSGRESAFFPK
jgi:hypothetical protein